MDCTYLRITSDSKGTVNRLTLHLEELRKDEMTVLIEDFLIGLLSVGWAVQKEERGWWREL